MLAIWEYFWDEADWSGGGGSSSTPPVVIVRLTDLGAGGGHSEYIPASEDYWMAREEFLSYLNAPPKPIEASAPAPVKPPPTLRPEVYPRLVAERKAAVALTFAAPDFKSLKAHFTRLQELDKNIETLKALKLQKERLQKIRRLRKGLLKISRLFLGTLLRQSLVAELRKSFPRR